MGVIEVVLSAVLCAVVVVSVSRIAAKAGYSPWWALVPAAAAGVCFATVAAVHGHARFGALSLHTILHDARALAIADAACLGLTVVLLVAFAVSEWPALSPADAAFAPGTSAARSKGNAKAKGAVAAQLPARMRIRALPDATGQPAGWFASGALGSGEQSYWDGSQWTAKRFWRNEMWIDQPVEPSLLTELTR